MKIALIDYDRTLGKGFSIFDICKLMEAKTPRKKGVTKAIDKILAEYLKDRSKYNVLADESINIVLDYLDGMPVHEFRKFIADEYNLQDHIQSGAKKLISCLKDRGYLTVVVSGTLDVVIELAQEILDFDAFFATTVSLKNSCYTKKLRDYLNGDVKADQVKKMLKAADESIGIGDSLGDFEMLKLVDKPYLVFADEITRDSSKQFGFTICDNLEDLCSIIENV